MGEAGSRRRLAKVLDEEEQEDSGNDEGSNGSRRGWLAKFSNLKVGPPRGTKPVTGQSVHVGWSGKWERWPRRGSSSTMGFPTTSTGSC